MCLAPVSSLAGKIVAEMSCNVSTGPLLVMLFSCHFAAVKPWLLTVLHVDY